MLVLSPNARYHARGVTTGGDNARADLIHPRPVSVNVAEPREGITPRALALAVALTPLNAYWVIQSEAIWYTGHPTTISLFSNVVFIVLLLALANLWLARRRPGSQLAPGELMTIYVFLSMTSIVAGHDLIQLLIPLTAHPAWFASPENRYNELFFGTPEDPGPVPRWLVVQDREALRGFFEGHTTPYRWPILRAWIVPLFWWGTFVIALLTALTLVAVLFRRQWTEKERLSYPVIQIPLEIATNLPALLTNRLFWYGFSIAAGVDLLNGLHMQWPLVPQIPLLRAFDFKQYMLGAPWDAMGPTFISIHLFAIGMCFFLPTDMIFSCWFFFLVYRLQQIAARAAGIDGIPGFPFITQQSAGAYLGLGVLALWISRGHLRALGCTLLGRPGGLDEADEPMPYRRAVLLWGACTAYMIVFGVAAGASLPVMLLFFFIFYGYAIAIARMRAELGPPAHDLHFSGPGELILSAIGSQHSGPGNTTVFSLFYWFNRAYRAHASPHALEGFKIAERLGMAPRRLLITMLIAVALGLLAACWASLHCQYAHGALTNTGIHFGWEPWHHLAGRLQNPQPPNLGATIATGVGFLVCLFLAAMRLTFTWWVFHPVGYAVSSTWSMEHLWFSLLVAWLIKSLLMRYGGARIFRPAVPFFIGLALGEFVVGSLWTIYGITWGVRVYRFWG